MSVLTPSVSFIDDKKRLFGIEFKEKRLFFKDPYNQLLTHQVARWRPEKNQAKLGNKEGLLSGIKTHSKAIHILFKILYYLSFGCINKSIAVILDNKAIYISTGSLQRWRRLNHEALLSLGILKTASRKNAPAVRQEELTALIKLLKTPPKDRPQKKRTIEECRDFFELASTAYELAKAKASTSIFPKANPNKLNDAAYAIAAFYILLKSKIKTPEGNANCGFELLEVTNHLKVRDFAAPEVELARLVTEEKLARLVAEVRKDLKEGRELSEEELKRLVTELKKGLKEGPYLSEEELKKLVIEGKKGLDGLDLVLFETIRVVYEDTQEGIKQRFFNRTPDLFSSVQTRNNPIQAKKLLIQIMKTNEEFAFDFTSKLLDYFIKGKPIPGNSAQESEFALNVISLGKAMKEQFPLSDPGMLLKNILKSSVLKISPIITEKNYRNLDLLFQIGTLSAWNLLKSRSEITEHPDGSKTLTCVVEEPHTLSLHFPPKNFYDNQECTKSSRYPFVTALSGKLTSESPQTPEWDQEAFEFVREFKEILEEEVILLEEMVKRLTLNPLENEQGHTPPEKIIEGIFAELDPEQPTPTELSENFFTLRLKRYSQYEDSDHIYAAYDPEAFDNLTLLYNKLEKLGKLIYFRYYMRFSSEFNELIDFQENGEITIDPDLLEKELLIMRTPEEHKKMIATYFPRYTIPQLPKKQPPKFKPKEELKLKAEEYLSKLFKQLTNHVVYSDTQGSCCVAALAQGIFKSEKASGNRAYIHDIRKAATHYMTNHPEQFFDTGIFTDNRDYNKLIRIKNPTEAQKEELKKIQINQVRAYAQKLLGSEQFALPALKAISFIIGRPIFIVDRKAGLQPYKLEANGSIEMEKINPHLDGEILYLHLHFDFDNFGHYHCLMPNRAGTERI